MLSQYALEKWPLVRVLRPFVKSPGESYYPPVGELDEAVEFVKETVISHLTGMWGDRPATWFTFTEVNPDIPTIQMQVLHHCMSLVPTKQVVMLRHSTKLGLGKVTLLSPAKHLAYLAPLKGTKATEWLTELVVLETLGEAETAPLGLSQQEYLKQHEHIIKPHSPQLYES